MTKQTNTSQGQQLVTDIADWMLTFLSMPRDYAVVCALFAINSYWFRLFDSCPYLSIVAATKRAGKTSLLETVAALCRGGDVVQNITEPSLFSMIEGADQWCVPCLDEFELRDDDMGQTLNGGYRVTGKAVRKNRSFNPADPSSRPNIEHRTYCQKAFACIGDLPDTLRDRSIVLVMQRYATAPQRKYRYSMMRAEASEFQRRIVKVIKTFPTQPNFYDVDWLQGRDEEIWMPLLTTAHALGFDATMMDLVIRASATLTKAKSAEALEYTSRQAAEDKAADRSHAEELLRDVLRVTSGMDRIWTVALIEKLHAIPTSGWPGFRGTGLTPHILSELLASFGIAPKQLSKRTGKQVVNKQGYDIAAIRKHHRV